mmetsp:Transcript_26872/g.45083  ORF Transcript_26872/g.45083 Transcript_26872/m.45083 type:complete len:200 (-) Transcript_26872:53-652(-)
METTESRAKPTTPVRALEFYSGIGGMRYALKRACLESTVLAAFDLNNVANDVYEHNFGERPVQGNLGTMTAKKLDKYGASLWTMSPPCQPYTRNGLQKGAGDFRASSFTYLLTLLPALTTPPSYILVENVVGFEASSTRKELVETLHANAYTCQEFLCTPLQFGIPYSRPRYFMLAKRQPLHFAVEYPPDVIMMHPPGI